MVNLKHALILACASTLMVVACGGEVPSADELTALNLEAPASVDEAALSPSHAVLPDDFNPDDVIQEEPDFVVQLEGKERISFIVADDGSVGVLAEAGETGSVLDHVLLGDAAPAIIYHAISRDPVPRELLDLHARLHEDGEVEDFTTATQGRLPGWLLNVSFANSSSPCLNSTFSSRHCAHPSYNANICILNGVGDHQWYTANVHRYKAGVCVQDGDAGYVLWFKERDTGYRDGCRLGHDRHYVLFSQVSWATTYVSYVWWRPSGANRRDFYFTGDPNPDNLSVMDMAQRWSRSTRCD